MTDDIDLKDFQLSLKDNLFVGAKLYPAHTTTNSTYGVTKIEKIFPALKLLVDYNKPLLIHGEKIAEDINLFDREKYFIDDELSIIRKKFPLLKITLEHVSTSYGVKYVKENENRKVNNWWKKNDTRDNR